MQQMNSVQQPKRIVPASASNNYQAIIATTKSVSVMLNEDFGY